MFIVDIPAKERFFRSAASGFDLGKATAAKIWPEGLYRFSLARNNEMILMRSHIRQTIRINGWDAAY